MTHEILFRGKRIDNGEWDYGYPFISDTDGSAYILRGSREFTSGHEVAPDTLKPYTGLTDRNGAKIFEGDIVEYGGKNYKMMYIDGFAAFDLRSVDNMRLAPRITTNTAPCMNVVGNIHNNPELFEVQNEAD